MSSVYHGGVFRIRAPLLQQHAKKILATPPTQLLAVIIGGVDRTLNVVKGTLVLSFVLTTQANTAHFQVSGFDPVAGQTVLIQSGTRRLAGTIARVVQHSVRKAAYKIYDVDVVDWTWLLNRRRVTKTYASGLAADVIITDLVTTFTTGFTTLHVQTGSPTISAPPQFRGQQVSVALQQIADLVRWRVSWDPDRDVHFVPTGAALPTMTTYAAATAGTAFVVPAGVGQVTVKAWGAAGGADGGDGGTAGAGGGFAQATVSTTPGETLLVSVGGGGARDTNSWQGGGGGGYSGVLRGTTPLVIAGGGGGGARDGGGGAGGGSTGSGSGAGGGGSTIAGGAAGANSDGADVAATAGASLAGGTGGGWTTGTGDAGATGGLNGGGAGGAKASGAPPSDISYLVVAGGGGGGRCSGIGATGGGGGAGGCRTGTLTLGLGAYTVTVGAGGGSQANGSDSVFGSITSTGGGRGGGLNGSEPAGDGGSGGGGTNNAVTPGNGTAGQGNAGGRDSSGPNPGGGGGAGAVGQDSFGSTAGAGGTGTASSISGASVTYAGGGGGGAIFAGNNGAGGAGGGGTGGVADSSGNTGVANGASGTANTGGGGGGAAFCEDMPSGTQIDTFGGTGGSGIVIVSYTTGVITATGGSITTAAGKTIHTFTASGIFTITSAAASRTGGGGGGGFFGGGGGGADAGTSHTGGGGGGSSYVTGVSTTTTAGVGATPGNAIDGDYAGSAGVGSSAAAGNPGRVVLTYTPAPDTGGSPDALTETNYRYEGLEYELDLSQLRTRVYGVGGGGSTTAPVAVGATSIPVDECGWYSSSGGTVIPHGQIVTYTGRSATSGPGNLTGVPASGAGSIVTALLQGDVCNLRVQVDDATAQTALAALEGGDGVHEDWIEDGTWDSATATAQATATLTAFKNTDVRGRYDSYDDRTTIGQLVTITLPKRNISAAVTLQRVTARHIAPDRWSYHAEFALVWSDLMDLIIGVTTASAKPS